MMKKFFLKNIAKILLPLFAVLLLVSCGKDSPSAPAFTGKTKEYKMYNRSTGTAIEAGTFTFTELASGGTKLVVQLNAGYRVAGIKFRTTMTVPQANGTELLFAELGDMDGSTGTLELGVLKSGSTNTEVKYSDVITYYTYLVKVMNGNNVQASGVIQ